MFNPIKRYIGNNIVWYVKLLMIVVCIMAAIAAGAQNLNHPNKRGPLGIQVNTLSGNVFIPRTDIYIPARSFDLDFTFYYNSFLFSEDYGYGKGWSFQYNIKYRHDTAGARLILWGDGRQDRYDSLPGGAYQSPRGFFNTLSQYQPGKYLLAEKDGVKYFFDDALHKRITKMEEPNGNFISFTYTDTVLTAITNAAGQSVTFTYNAERRLATLVDAIASPSRTFSYSYEAGGKLAEVTDPLNGKYSYAYLVNGPIKSLADKNNNKVDIIYFSDFSARELIGCNKRLSFSYDTTSKTTVVTDHLASGNQVTKYKYQKVDNISWITSVSGNCCGFNMSYEYDEQGNVIKMTDANGKVYTYTYDAFGNELTVTGPLGGMSTYTYTTDFKKISSFRDPKGNLYSLSYDAKGNLVQLVSPGNNIYTATYNANGDIISSTDPKGNIYSYNYDAWGNPSTVSGPNGYNATLSFDARGRLLSYTDARGNSRTAGYDILDRLKIITDPFNNSIQLTYDAAGNMVSYKNKNNETSTLNYDASNRLVKVTGATGNEASFTFDGMDKLLSVKNALGQEIKLSYDSRNRVKENKDAEGNNATYGYDGNGNITSINFPNGRTIYNTYDALNRIVSISDASGTIADLSYDQNSNITRYTNATGATTTADYDSLNRIKKITDPLGNSKQYTYDKNNNISSVTDREGRTSLFTHDSLNRLKSYTDNNGFVVTAGYDAASNITSLADQNNNITTYTYDDFNRRKRMILPDGKYSEYTYDKESNITAARLTDGTTITYQYDTLNRVTSRTLPGGEVYSYTYDKLNRVLTATNNSGTVTFSYDALSRVLSESFDGRTTRYNYNIAGRTQTTIYPDSTIVIKEFDSRGRLIKISKDSITMVEYAYNSADHLTNKSFANGVSSSMQYDFANRLNSLITTSAGGIIQNSQFSYDREYNKTAVTRLNNPSLSEQFSYDNAYRLTNYKRGPAGSPVIQNTYTYDAVGNRTAANLNGIAMTYSINNLNQLTATNGTSYIFDERGNITHDGVFHKTYDAENRLVKDSASPINVIVYGYDALNRRIVKTINGNTLKYTYSGPAQIEERDNGSVLLNRTVFANFLLPVVNERNGSAFYYHPNELGSVESITNNGGRLIESYRYDAYGKLSRYDSLSNPLASSIAGNRFGFTGQEYDSATNSYRFFYRNYSPETGVFNQRDLIEYEDGMGMYQYMGNSPANGIDIWGLKKPCPEERTTSSTSSSLRLSDFFWQYNNFTSVWTVTGEFANTLNNPLLSPFSLGLNLLTIQNSYNTLTNPGSTTGENTDAIINGIGGASGTAVSGTTIGAFAQGATQSGITSAAEAYTAGNTSVATALSGGVSRAVLRGGGALAGGIALYSILDFTFKQVNPEHEGFAQYFEDKDLNILGFDYTKGARNWGDNSDEVYSQEYLNQIRVGELTGDKNHLQKWLKKREEMENRQRRWREDHPCPEGGYNLERPLDFAASAIMSIFAPKDPNLIIGPDGQPDKKWVSVKDRMPYTILFENDSTATARARYIKITTAVEPKQDITTLELGNFGFNNQSFDIPAGTTAYYSRLDIRDSTGVYVDVTAGYDVIHNQVFWEFQAIDPATLLPPEDPSAGFLFLQDSIQTEYGKGFVSFSIKPKSNSQTLDTIGAKAFIVFDQNDTIPTNIHTNTIDAFAPISSLSDLPDVSPDTEVTLHYTGVDDLNGSGLKWYSIYISDDNGAPELFASNLTKTDTAFRGVANHLYKFYLSATDSVGNVEELILADSVRITSGEQVICPNDNTTFDIKITGAATYQWQVDNGTGYTSVSDGGLYSGATAKVLSLTNAPTNMYGFKYRCLVNGSPATEIFLLKFAMTWEGSADNSWENVANWSCNSLPDMNTDVIITGGKANYPQVNSNVTVRSIRLSTGASAIVNSGFTLTVLK